MTQSFNEANTVEAHICDILYGGITIHIAPGHGSSIHLNKGVI